MGLDYYNVHFLFMAYYLVEYCIIIAWSIAFNRRLLDIGLSLEKRI